MYRCNITIPHEISHCAIFPSVSWKISCGHKCYISSALLSGGCKASYTASICTVLAQLLPHLLPQLPSSSHWEMCQGCPFSPANPSGCQMLSSYPAYYHLAHCSILKNKCYRKTSKTKRNIFIHFVFPKLENKATATFITFRRND